MMAELEPLYPRPLILATRNNSESKSNYTSAKNMVERAAAHTPSSGPSVQDIFSFVGIAIMLVWPWIFFGVVWAKKGIQMNNHLANIVENHPHTTTYLITFICSLISLIISELFALAIIRFAQELVTYRKPTQPFHLTVLLAFRRQTWPWGKSMNDVKYLMTKNRWWPAASVIVCALIFPHLMSSTTTLLTPTSFNRTAMLTGTELNFSSTDDDCLSWFKSNTLNNSNCDWKFSAGLAYTSCLGVNHVVDFLEAGRDKIIESLTNNSESLTFLQLELGPEGGLHFRGSMEGILPIVPNSLPTLNTLAPSPLSDPEIAAGMISYDYTLNHQGFVNNVSCSYKPAYPFQFQSLVNDSSQTLAYSANCANLGEIEALTNVTYFTSTNSLNLLVYWACQPLSNGTPTASYNIYLAGVFGYASEIGNITCAVNPIQAATYPVTYWSTQDIFSAAEAMAPSPITFPALISNALVGLGEVISIAQNGQTNLFAQSIMDFGQRSSVVLPTDQWPPEYLRLCEQMIQGILEYEMTYLRLIYSRVPDPPSSCLRTVPGWLHYEVLGWFVTDVNIGFLIPLTIINLGALVALAQAMIIAKEGGYIFHPSHPRPVVYDEHIDEEEQVPDEWRHKVSIRPTTAIKEYVNKRARGNPEKDDEAVE